MAGPEVIAAPLPSGDAIFELLGELRDAGFRLGIREHVIAQELALACRAEDGGIDPARLRNWLAPVLCHSPEEQRELYRIFQTWWSRRAPARSSVSAATAQKYSTPDEAIVARSLPWRWMLSFAAAVVLVAAAAYLVDQRRHRDHATGATGHVAANPAGTASAEPSPPAAGVVKQASAPGAAASEPRNVLSIVVNVVDPQGKPVPGASVLAEMRLAHAAPIRDASLSRDGTGIVIASADGTAQMWDVQTRRTVGANLRHGGAVNSAAFSADGTRVVTASDDKTAQVWNARSGQPIGAALQHEDIVHSASFSADGARVLTASKDGIAGVWDAMTGKEIAHHRHDGTVSSAAFSPDGQRVVTSDDKTAAVWDATSGTEIARLRHDGTVSSAAFSPDGQRVVTASDDKMAAVWDVTTGREIARLRHDATVRSAAFSADGQRIVTASDDKTATVWDARTGNAIARLRHDGPVASAAFSPDGQQIVTASGDRTARVWNSRTGQPVGAPLQHGNAVFSAAFSADGTRVVTASHDNTARLWDARTAQSVGRPFEHVRQVNLAAFRADGRQVVTSGADETARVWDARTGQPVGAPLVHNNSSATFGADGRRVVTASKDGTARVWDLPSGQAPVVTLQSSSGLNSAAFSVDGTRVVTTTVNHTAEVWDLRTGQPISAPLQHQYPVGWAAFSPDGTRVLTTSSDDSARVWDAATGQAVGAPLQHESAVNSAAFSPDGTRVVTASSDHTARVWDAQTGQPVGAPLRHRDYVYSAEFSPDGTRIATASADKTAQLWDARTGQRVNAPLLHDDLVSSAAFTPDGSRLVTASSDGTTRVWDASTGKIIGAPVEHRSTMIAPSFSVDGQRIVAGSGEGAIVWDAAPPPQTDREGMARLSASPAPKPQRVSVSHPDYEPAPSFPIDYGSGQLTLRAELSPTGNVATRWLLEHVDLLRLIGALVPVLAAACWTAWALYRRKLVLERRASTRAHDLARVRLAEPAHRLYRGGPFVRARIEARRRQAASEGELDADATIDRTIRHPGFFSPVFRPRSRLPAYLALVDRAGFHDQQARAVEEFIDGLREGGVAVDSYFFDRDPRLCTSSRGGDGVYRSLWELSALHAEHRLLLFCDGSGLADPATGRVAVWTHGFSPWSERALLTPVPACHWSAHELNLAQSGFRVVPFTPAGLRLFVESLQPANLRPALLEWRAPYPPLLAEQPGRWQGRGRPRPEEIDELCWQLRAYLGPDGFRWLSALAVYPSMDWFLTVFMGLGLRTSAAMPLLEEELLLAVTRLPWLRHGFMPDWLRLRLVSELGRDDGRTVRELLESLLRARLDSPGGRFQLDVARPAAVPGGRRWRRFFADLLRTEPPGSPLHDYVFVEFLLGRRPAKLQVPLPGGWRRWVYHRGLRSLGIRPAVVMAAAALLAVTATLSARPLAERLQASQTAATPSRITQTAWTPGTVTTDIPKLVGLEMRVAVRTLDAFHLTLGSSDSSDHGAIVTAQNPAPGAVAAEGSRVDVKTASAEVFRETARREAERKVATVPSVLEVLDYPKGTSTSRLTIDGEKWTGKNPVQLPAGTHALAFDAGQFGTLTNRLAVTRGQTTQVSIPADVPRVNEKGPFTGRQGEMVRQSVSGRSLGRIRAVEISGPGVSVGKNLVYSPESARVSPLDDGVLIFTVSVDSKAKPGPRAITLINSAGWRIPLRQVFEVLPAR